jgi:hypothetical protein
MSIVSMNPSYMLHIYENMYDNPQLSKLYWHLIFPDTYNLKLPTGLKYIMVCSGKPDGSY